MRTKQSYLEEAKARAISGTPPRAASPFEWEDWYRYRGHDGDRPSSRRGRWTRFLK